MLRVTIYTHETLKFRGEGDPENPPEPLVLQADYVSLVNGSTYGPPPLIAPTTKEPKPTAQVGDTVVYISTALVPAFEIERISD